MKYQNSQCRAGYLHKFAVIKQTNKGLLERCERCGLSKHFNNNVSNANYLSYHLRQALQSNHPLFKKEYPNINV